LQRLRQEQILDLFVFVETGAKTAYFVISFVAWQAAWDRVQPAWNLPPDTPEAAAGSSP